MPELVPTLQVMAAAHDVSPLLRYLLPQLIHAAFAFSSGENDDAERVDEDEKVHVCLPVVLPQVRWTSLAC